MTGVVIPSYWCNFFEACDFYMALLCNLAHAVWVHMLGDNQCIYAGFANGQKGGSMKTVACRQQKKLTSGRRKYGT